MRLFVAIPLPDEVLDALEHTQEGMPGARWIPAENMHLTLRFLGEVGNAEFDDIMQALAEVVVPPFPLDIASVGHFESRGVPKVLWAGVRANSALSHLHAKVEQAVKRCDLPPEPRKFAPHITLARLHNSYPSEAQAFLQRNALLDAGTVWVYGFTLFSSHLGKGDPHYRSEVDYLFEVPVLED
jgi:2'-5' RNA ligase